MNGVVASARAALARATPADAIAQLDAAWRGLEDRRALRHNRHIGFPGMLRCPACNSFVRGGPCPRCGYLNGWHH